MAKYDVIVAGLGTHGGATAYQLAKRGLKVLGFDRFRVPHENGSALGESRIIREAYHENPVYVPFVQRAYELWEEAAKESGRQTFLQTGGLMMGPAKQGTFPGAKKSAELYKLKHEILTPKEVRARFPAFAPWEGVHTLRETRAGAMLLPAALEVHVELAKRHGAELHWDEPVLEWTADPNGVKVRTSKRIYEAKSLVLAAGVWNPELLRDLGLPLVVERQVMFWFKPKRNAQNFLPDKCPIFIWEDEQGRSIYGFPDIGNGFKIGIHHEGETVDPNTVERVANKEDERVMREWVKKCFPDSDGTPVASKVCLYTNTPDLAFILDHHPKHKNVVIVSCCSGHGFKFGAAVGEAAADLATGKKPKVDLAFFSVKRFLKK